MSLSPSSESGQIAYCVDQIIWLALESDLSAFVHHSIVTSQYVFQLVFFNLAFDLFPVVAIVTDRILDRCRWQVQVGVQQIVGRITQLDPFGKLPHR